MKLETSIRKKIEDALKPVFFEIENESVKHRRPPGAETHFRLLVVSEKFDGLSRVDRQRLVASLFDDERDEGLHALTQKALTPTEWEAQKDQAQTPSPNCKDGLRFDPKQHKKTNCS